MAQHAMGTLAVHQGSLCLPYGNQLMASVHAQAPGNLHMTALHLQKRHAHPLCVLQATELPEAAAGSGLQQASTEGPVLTDLDRDTMLAELHQVLHSQEAVPQPQVPASSPCLAMPHLLPCRWHKAVAVCVVALSCPAMKCTPLKQKARACVTSAGSPQPLWNRSKADMLRHISLCRCLSVPVQSQPWFRSAAGDGAMLA